MPDDIQITRVTGVALDQFIPDLARLRIRVFRDYPYLYDGDAEYEARYLATYARASGSVVVLARDGERIVGASTALPLAEETDAVQTPFLAAGYDPRQVFYLGESVLLPEYRGRGIGVRFFEEREAHARALATDPASGFGPLTRLAFCAVERAADDPRRPSGYQPLDGFWRNRGYSRQPALRTEFSWKEIGEAAESPKPMVFWLKAA
ncbi:MAG: GNAT family N-acetyltransferase [Thiohalocapsa sp.]|jgi:GNAT superfamily N-acetyltransferase|uniref:GNAT family N-acetyltransferase n=1 Tax=Thiohalocapsa sp. TaxID=2497641 RepID=UPI0025D60C88|nr:GNAT family N-acetyltransferase [Thiohalocapsa sp.]MCG6943463.1 GNAT family N-acetyltransferase [Thiohalocapsa sp.]